MKKLFSRTPKDSADFPPFNQDEMATEHERRQNFLRYLNRVWLVFGIVTLVFLPVFPEERPLYVTLVTAIFPTYFLVRMLNLKGDTALAGGIFSLLVNFTIMSLFLVQVHKLGPYEAFQTQATIWMLMSLAIGFAGAVVDKRAAVGLAFLNTVLLLSMRLTLAPTSDQRPSVVVFWWLIALTIWLYEETLSQALGSLRATRGHLEELVEVRTYSLNETVQQLQVAKVQLEEANKELEAFSYSVSHDLRTPLRAIEGYSNLLKQEHNHLLNDEGQLFLARIYENTQRMNRLIDDLLLFSRFSRQPLHKQPVQLTPLVKEVLNELQPCWEGRKIGITIGELPACEADPTLIYQVFSNLLSNAIKYSGKVEEARIEVNSCIDQGKVVYFVRDNGVGFDMKFANKLFGVFQRLHRQDEFEGTGVGLAMVQRIIHRHGGRIWVEAVVNEGATFFFTLGETISKE